MLLQSPVLWQPEQLRSSEQEWGGGRRAPKRLLWAWDAGVDPVRGESRVPCSTKATSGSFAVTHRSLRRLAALPGPPEGGYQVDVTTC